MKKTSTQRVAATRKRQAAAGLVRVEVNIMPKERDALKSFIEALKSQRKSKHED